MQNESLEFLQVLLARASVGAIALTALPTTGTGAVTCHVPLTLPMVLTEAVSRLQDRNNLGDVNALVGIATRRPGLTRYQRGGKADLLELPALYADIDRPPAEVYPRLSHCRLSPSLVVASGFGTHLYWLFAEPTTNFHQCDAILAGLAHALGGDRLTVAQSMRLPGTQNPKAGRGPCYILKSEPERRYTLSDFAAYVVMERQVQPSHPITSVYLDDLAQEIAHLLIADYGGHPKQDGWIAALCPAGHTVDYPGKHFYYNEALRLGYCFGRHSRLLLKDLKLLMSRGFRCERKVH